MHSRTSVDALNKYSDEVVEITLASNDDGNIKEATKESAVLKPGRKTTHHKYDPTPRKGTWYISTQSSGSTNKL
jgi:hypothetical protein